MLLHLLYVLLAILGLSFLVFIHELGHLWMARRVGMRVEAFGIGFGRPVKVWNWWGVRWELCILPFGGYVRIAGMEKKGALEPHQIPDGFFGKGPWARIQVAAMGPIANMVFALLAFTLLWASGGREEPFSLHTQLIGWVDPSSPLYQQGVRPGDRITSYGGRPYEGWHDLILTNSLSTPTTEIAGREINFYTKEQTPYEWVLHNDPWPGSRSTLRTIGVSLPASYLMYQKNRDARGEHYPLNAPSPAVQAGLQEGDQIIWVQGEFVFSLQQLQEAINRPHALLIIEREGTSIPVLVPRMKVRHLQLSLPQSHEMDDWRYEEGLTAKLRDLNFIPYILSDDAVVESEVSYWSGQSQESSPSPDTVLRPTPLNRALQPGDKILAVDGIPIHRVRDVLRELQTPRLSVVVRRSGEIQQLNIEDADQQLIRAMNWDAVLPMITSVGGSSPVTAVGDYHLLAPIVPRSADELPTTETMAAQREENYAAEQKAIEEGTEEPSLRQQRLQQLAARRGTLRIGVPVVDRAVVYNPNPAELFGAALDQTWFSLRHLVGGALSVKQMSGPVGIVHAVQWSFSVSYKEALYWLGFISLNLGLVNLLPIPVLDGGHISFALWEAATGRPISARAMRRLILPFVLLIIGFFLFITLHDFIRLFSN